MSGRPASEAWLELLAVAADGGQRWIDALRIAGGAAPLLAMGESSWRKAGLGRSEIGRLRERSAPPAAWRDWLAAPEHDLVTYGSARYPPGLAELADAPLALWIDGRKPELLHLPQLAIVGSRNPTRNGLTAAERFAAEISGLGITITSGLALGIDAASHRGGLCGPGGSIAVLGNGIDHIYPRANAGLADEVRSAGLIVSEYPPTAPARAWQFPRRNRIIAALSLGTLVIEATRRSGSLITARLAAEQGREVFALPGSIHNALSKGCHNLIRDGAKLVESAGHIIEEIAPQLAAAIEDDTGEVSGSRPDALPEKLRGCLEFSPIDFDSLVLASGLTAGELSSMLLHLELQGKIEALPGGRYCRLGKRA